MVGFVHGISDAEKYELIGNLVDNHTQHDLIRALFQCAIPSGPVMLTDYGILIEDHKRYYDMAAGSDMPITGKHTEILRVTVPEFLSLLTKMVDAGGMTDMWPGKIRVQLRIAGWPDIPAKADSNSG